MLYFVGWCVLVSSTCVCMCYIWPAVSPESVILTMCDVYARVKHLVVVVERKNMWSSLQLCRRIV